MDEHISLNLAARYAEHWGMWEGMRELVQNWHDGHLETGPPNADVDYAALPPSKLGEGQAGFVATVAHSDAGTLLGWVLHDAASNRLIMVNRGITISRQALLLGFSKKAKHRQAVGQFGEGMKVGALALLRNGLAVSMDTGDERWSFELVHDNSYDMQVLGVHALPRAAATEAAEAEGSGFCALGDLPEEIAPTDSVCIVEGITAVEWESITPKFLFLTDHGLANDEAVATPQGTLLLAEKHRGSLFVKGIWIAQYEDMVAGVDFASLQLDRDRVASLRREDVEHQVASMWVRAASSNKAVLMKFFKMAQATTADAQIDMRHAAFYADSDVAALLADAWAEHFGDLLPVSPSDQLGTLSQLRDEYAMETFQVSHTLASILRKDDRHQSLDKTLAMLVEDGANADKDNRGASEVIALTSLTEESLDMLGHTASLVATVVPHFDLLESIELVKSGGGDDVDLLALGLLAPTTSPYTAICLRDDRLVVPEAYLEHDGPLETCPVTATRSGRIGAQRCRCREARLATATIEVLSTTMEVDLSKRGVLAKAMHQRLLASLATQACGMCPAGCIMWHASAAGAAGASSAASAAAEVSGVDATPRAIEVLAARERAMQKSIEAYRLKQVSTEQAHLSKLKALERRVAAADTLAMQLEVERMNMQARAKKEAEAVFAAKVGEAEARLAKAGAEKMALEADLQFHKDQNAALEAKVLSVASSTERRVATSLKRQAALKTSLTSALELLSGAADRQVASVIQNTLEQLGVAREGGSDESSSLCCVCMDAQVQVVLMPVATSPCAQSAAQVSLAARCAASKSRTD
eukprot:CAMPEP_0182556200 /NCGR_PEP_ID=MMETSP1324-20130603/548_1 /TAXON_ID=236786 /ORGANISM="Florenciella sp., Strain RCC1587" /LENGTH=813 /DNA_ID=CAMNT_0024768055 /DNA_START=13 /DNA_END=2455 /DNA_ORIENTATION=+